MRYRKLDKNGDMRFGHSAADFWYNTPDAVGQAIKTRLLLFAGEWFLDTTEGTPWGGFPLNDQVVAQGRILGKGTQQQRDVAIKSRVLLTPGATRISNYFSTQEPDTRTFSVGGVVDTIYGGQITIGPLVIEGFLLGGSPLGGGAPL